MSSENRRHALEIHAGTQVTFVAMYRLVKFSSKRSEDIELEDGVRQPIRVNMDRPTFATTYLGLL